MKLNPSIEFVKNSIDEPKISKRYPKITARLTEELEQALCEISHEIEAKNSSESTRWAIQLAHTLLQAKKEGQTPAIINQNSEITPIFD